MRQRAVSMLMRMCTSGKQSRKVALQLLSTPQHRPRSFGSARQRLYGDNGQVRHTLLVNTTASRACCLHQRASGAAQKDAHVQWQSTRLQSSRARQKRLCCTRTGFALKKGRQVGCEDVEGRRQDGAPVCMAGSHSRCRRNSASHHEIGRLHWTGICRVNSWPILPAQPEQPHLCT